MYYWSVPTPAANIESERQLVWEVPAALAQARPPDPGPPGVGSRCTTHTQIPPRAARLGCNGAQWPPVVRQQ
jgi:hypothetical protein